MENDYGKAHGVMCTLGHCGGFGFERYWKCVLRASNSGFCTASMNMREGDWLDQFKTWLQGALFMLYQAFAEERIARFVIALPWSVPSYVDG